MGGIVERLVVVALVGGGDDLTRVGAPLPSLSMYFVRVQCGEVQRVKAWVLLDVGIGSYEARLLLFNCAFVSAKNSS
jgi:hypothetical protein